jgi:hypothetical protein
VGKLRGRCNLFQGRLFRQNGLRVGRGEIVCGFGKVGSDDVGFFAERV